MEKKLYKYQQDLVDVADKSTGLFWDMGLGKTITSIGIFKKYNLNLLYVICPLSMIDEWCREFENQTGKKAIPYKKIKGNVKNYIVKNDIYCVVVNYETAWRITDYSWLDSNSMIILDESHKIKNPSSRVGKFIKYLRTFTPYKICLSGTPQSNGYIDYYNQLYFLGIIDMSFTSFKDRYCVYEDKMFNGIKIKQLTGYKNIDEFDKWFLSKCHFLKIQKVYSDVVKHNTIPIKTNNKYESAKKDRVIYYSKDGIVTDRKEINKYLQGDESSIINSYKLLDNVGAYRVALRQLLNSEDKLQWVEDFLDGYDKRVVIFYNYNVELDSLVGLLEKLKRPYSIYNGGTKDFTNFKENENGVVLCNYMSGSVGINDLVISNVFIAYSPTESYILWEQAKKRIDRNGQLNTPIYYYLSSGFEDRIYYSLSRGKTFDDRVFLEELESGLIK